MMTGGYNNHVTVKQCEDPSKKVTDFNRMSGAKITGTKNEDTYNLNGCNNTTVDVSQNDGKKDTIKDSMGRTGSVLEGTDWSNDNNTFKLGESDDAIDFRNKKYYKGKGTYNTGTGNE